MSTEAKQPKQPYQAPLLQTYGNIRAITQAVGKTAQQDGGVAGQGRPTMTKL